MKPILLFSLLLSSAFVRPFCDAQTTPSAGSPGRTEILDALRKPVQAALKQPVLFKVDHLKVLDSWAFYTGSPVQPNGKAINYKGTPYQEAIDAGAFDDGICALLQKKDGAWKVISWQLGATDAPWVAWPADYKAPAGIFPK